MLTKKNNLKLIGRREFVDFPLLGVFKIEAKIDTGAYTSSIHCSEIYIKTENNKLKIKFIRCALSSNSFLGIHCLDFFDLCSRIRFLGFLRFLRFLRIVCSSLHFLDFIHFVYFLDLFDFLFVLEFIDLLDFLHLFAFSNPSEF